MEVHPRMFYYNDVQDGTAVVIKALESTDSLTPLHIPPGPPVFPERYEELRKTFQLCKPVFKAGQDPGGRESMLPESHRIYEPPYKFTQGPCHDEDPKNVPLRCARYLKYKTPGALLIEGRYRPFHPYVHGNIDIQVGPDRKEDVNESINREAMACSRHFTERNGQRDEAPKSTFQPPALDISPRAANLLENVKKALWLSTYKRDYTGTGPMNPLLLDDYNAKLIGRATGELGKDVELRETFHSAMSQTRPLEGRIARFLQGRPQISHPQHEYSTENYEPPLHCRDHSSINRYSEGVQNGGKTSLSPVQQDTQNKASQRNKYLLYNWIQPEIAYQEENSQDKKLPWNKFQKITDTWKTDQLYQRQLSVPPEPQPLVKAEESIYYEDLPPSHLNRYIVWHNPAILSKPTSTPLKFERCASKPDLQCASNVRETVRSYTPTSEWIPNCGMVRPQTKLLDIQDSFTKTDAIKYLNDLTRRGLRDLRDHDREGRKHKFRGIHAFFL
ncbi:uncharacterized protein C7orf31 homolog [Python bivittatus]|uniref:Uncharacterized protein C7orf31 homolog n=1 Tax=Python bivittatus TaxID=176946 RepID=A0A9F5IFM9_PYTBI|nr:uncharacterized protein C7orf31 homolog [Python bivittatus]